MIYKAAGVKKNHTLLDFIYDIYHDLDIEKSIFIFGIKTAQWVLKDNFSSIKLKDLGSAGDYIIINSLSVLEVIKDVVNTTSELNEQLVGCKKCSGIKNRK